MVLEKAKHSCCRAAVQHLALSVPWHSFLNETLVTWGMTGVVRTGDLPMHDGRQWGNHYAVNSNAVARKRIAVCKQ